MSKGKVVVGMSGGVDSSVAAWLLKEQGYDVIGVTMQIWQDEENDSSGRKRRLLWTQCGRRCQTSCSAIGIPYYVMNFKQEFQKNVIDYFTKEYLNGRTPNPCIACNRYVKWEALLAEKSWPSEQTILQQDIMQGLIQLAEWKVCNPTILQRWRKIRLMHFII